MDNIKHFNEDLNASLEIRVNHFDCKRYENDEEQYNLYCVSHDDTIEKVAAKFSMTPNNLISLNKLHSRTLFVNQILKVHYPCIIEEVLSDSINKDNELLSKNQETNSTGDDSCDSILLPLHWKDTHLKVTGKYITDTEGIIKGKLLLTPAFFTFIPAFGDPVVMEYGDENYTVHLPNNKIACVSMYNDAEMMVYKRSQRINMINTPDSPQNSEEWIDFDHNHIKEPPSICNEISETTEESLNFHPNNCSRLSSLDEFLNRSIHIQDIQKCHSMKFFDHKYLCIVASPRYRKIKAIYQKDDEYWFIVPEHCVHKLMDYFLTQAQTKYDIGADVDSSANWISEVITPIYTTGQLARRNSFAKVEDVDGTLGKMKNKLEKVFKKLRSKSIHWEIVNTDMDFGEDFNNESEDVASKILDSTKVKELMGHLPAETTGAIWELIYTTERDGWSLATMYRKVYNSTRGCCLLLIKDSNEKIFGAMCNSYIRMSSSFYGNGTTFIFRWNPKFEKFSYSHKNNYFLLGQPDYFSIGCSNSKNALRIEKNLFHGVTQDCETFNSPPLVPSKSFDIINLEVWSFY